MKLKLADLCQQGRSTIWCWRETSGAADRTDEEGCCTREQLERSTHRSKAEGDRAGQCEEDERSDGEPEGLVKGVAEGAIEGITYLMVVMFEAAALEPVK